MAILAKLQERHPAPATALSIENLVPPAGSPPFQLSLDPNEFNLAKVLLALPKGSAPGLDGWRFEFLRLVAASASCCFSLLIVVNLMLQGGIPDDAVPPLANCRLIPLKKGDNDVRPIAIASCLRRLVARVVCYRSSRAFQAFFQPIQFGVAVAGGTEAIIHYARAHLQKNPDHCLIQVDIKNAFNEISRQAFFAVLLSAFPGLFPFVKLFYGIEGGLFIDDIVSIASREGVQQGDPLGPFLFCLGIQAILADLTVSHPECKILAYMDDISILGPPAAALRVFHDLQTGCVPVGLRVNPDKCVIFSRTQNLVGLDVGSTPVVDMESSCIKVLGVPLGEDAACGQWLLDRTNQIIATSKCLENLVSLQHRWLLFKCCISQSFTFFLRTCPRQVLFSGAGDDCKPALVWRNSLLDWLQKAAQSDVWTPGSVEQVFLPAAFGGLGFIDPIQAADAAFYGSWCLVGSLLQKFDPGLVTHSLEAAGNGPLRDVFSAFQRLKDEIRLDLLSPSDELPSPQSVIESPILFAQARAM
ncbi:MAG: reverse transcriptase domain-containing protein, partial [Polynucleobacter sp.]|nr:reverse transcriptase domain-containing protein [Polynucleobacter sp.]